MNPCKTCCGAGTIAVLGAGGDYEDYPCPECRPEQAKKVKEAPQYTYDNDDE